MRIKARATAGGITCELGIETSNDWARVNLDGERLYDVPSEEWPQFSSVVLGDPALPPDIPAEKWASVEARRQGSSAIRQGERQQLLISAVNLAAQLPVPALFEDEPLETLSAATLFYGQHVRDTRGNFLYVPSPEIQLTLLNDPAMSGEMCRVGYLFDFETEDGHGNVARIFYRPYNTGFATSRRWPLPLQRLYDQIEEERNPSDG